MRRVGTNCHLTTELVEMSRRQTRGICRLVTVSILAVHRLTDCYVINNVKVGFLMRQLKIDTWNHTQHCAPSLEHNTNMTDVCNGRTGQDRGTNMSAGQKK